MNPTIACNDTPTIVSSPSKKCCGGNGCDAAPKTDVIIDVDTTSTTSGISDDKNDDRKKHEDGSLEQCCLSNTTNTTNIKKGCCGGTKATKQESNDDGKQQDVMSDSCCPTSDKQGTDATGSTKKIGNDDHEQHVGRECCSSNITMKKTCSSKAKKDTAKKDIGSSCCSTKKKDNDGDKEHGDHGCCSSNINKKKTCCGDARNDTDRTLCSTGKKVNDGDEQHCGASDCCSPNKNNKQGGYGHIKKDTCTTTCSTNKKGNDSNSDQNNSIVRSVFECKGICCSSEVPAIMDCLNPVEGITNIMVNVPLKQVIVDHAYEKIPTSQIQRVLNDNSFSATIVRDGGTAVNNNGDQNNINTKGRSRLYVSGICCPMEVPAVESILNGMGDGVYGHMINVTTKTVYVDHDSSINAIEDIANALEAGGFGATIEFDHSKEVNGTISPFVTSRFDIILEDELSLNDSHVNILQKKIAAHLDVYVKSKAIDNCDIDFEIMKASIVHNAFIISAHEIATTVSEKSSDMDNHFSVTFNTNISFEVQVDGNDIENKSWDFPEFDPEGDGNRVFEEKQSIYSLHNIILVTSGIAWIVSMFFELLYWLKYIGIISVVLTFPPIAVKACKSLRRCRFDANVLMGIAMIGACALQEFTEAAAVGFLFSISDFLQFYTTKRARDALCTIVDLKPEAGNLIHPQTKALLLVPVESLPIGCLVAIKSGDSIPCDGIVMEGSSTVDESSLTGESRPIQKMAGNEVSGGTVNSGNTQLVVQITSSSNDSAISRLIALVEEAQASRSKQEQLVDKVANIYTPILLITALLMITIPWAFGNPVGERWTMTALVLIVAACPCALIISTPVSYVAGLAQTAQKGILVKGGVHLETLAAVKQIYFDKTGTLTEGNFKMLELDVTGEDMDRKTVLNNLYIMEERASHPLSIALAQGAKNEGITIEHGYFELSDHSFLPGEGVKGTINTKLIYVGNERLFRRLNLFDSLPESEKVKIQGWESMGATVGFMSIDNHIVCSYCAMDAIRPEAKQIVADFHDMGINVTILTGDNRKTALAVGTSLGLKEDAIKSGLLPEEKLEIVSDTTNMFQKHVSSVLSKQKTVLMCGDGVNDAPALAAANIGVAMGSGSALAMQTSDVTLLDSSLKKLALAIKVGKNVKAKIVQNVTFSILVKVIVIVFTLMGQVTLMYAIAADLGGMLVVTLNSMALLADKKKMRKGKKFQPSTEKRESDLIRKRVSISL